MQPVVSICVITYNQEKFISQTLDGILSQKTNFDYQIVLGEDGSTDNTRKICLQYQAKHPDKFKLLLNDKNIGMMNNFYQTLSACDGKYVAICEGDDYWIDENKLQKQVDFLDNNPDYGLVFTDANHLYLESGKLIRAYDKSHKRKVPSGDVFEELLYDNPYRTCTSLFKHELVQKKFYMLIKNGFPIGDKILWFLLGGKAKVGYLPDATAVYRISANSASHFTGFNKELSFIKSGYKMSLFFSDFYNYPLNKKRLKRHFKQTIISMSIRKGYYKTLFYYYRNPFLIIKILIKEKVARKILELLH